MSRARLATLLTTYVRPTYGLDAHSEEVPILTEQPRDYDFDLVPEDRIDTGPFGIWSLIVKTRHVGTDGILVIECDLDAERRPSRAYDPLDVLLNDGWMPDMGAALHHQTLWQFLPAEPVVDPVELARSVVSNLLPVSADYTDLPAGLDSVIRRWGDLRDVPPAEAA